MARTRNQNSAGVSPEISDEVTLLVFKDNYAARTFRIPLAWFSRMGTLLGLLLLVAVVSAVLAIRFYRNAKNASPARLHDLEQEITDLRASLATAQSSVAAAPSPLPQPSSTAPAQMQPAPPPASVGSLTAGMFSLFPAQVQPVPDPAQVPIGIHNQKATWTADGKVLNLSFNIQYHREDGGNQQGKIILLARGPEILLGYPDGLFSTSGAPVLVTPEKGEYFSVSRFRQVNARFGPVRSSDSVREVDAFLLNEAGQIMIYDRIAVESARGKPKTGNALNGAPKSKDSAE